MKNYSEQSVGISERIHILDILRGFAIFGILSVNIMSFAHPDMNFDNTKLGANHAEVLQWYDRFALWFTHYFTEGKFYILFSFLFGMGFSVQLARAEAKGNNILSFYPRRLLLLFAIGLLHAILWWGDVLRLYAVLGFGLLAIRKLSNKTLLVLAVLCFCLSGIVSAFPQVFGDEYSGIQSGIAGVLSSLTMGIVQMGPMAMTMFLLGRVMGRMGFFSDLSERKPIFKKTIVFGLLISVVLRLIVHFIIGEQSAWRTIFTNLSDIAMTSVYVSILSLLSLRKNPPKILVQMANVGRMALTNYLSQTVICIAFFKIFGLESQLQNAWLLLMTIVLYALQMWFSKWWLSRFRYGFLEWLWRSLTYKKIQKLRL